MRLLTYYGHIQVGPDCWQWEGRKSEAGYGFYSGRLAHRVMYALTVGDLIPGLTIDHRCGNPSCVNPAHLEQVTYRVNILRGNTLAAANAAKTHCYRGHPFDELNTFRSPQGKRRCRACQRFSYHRRTEVAA
jgi:hypothetical protein